MKDERSMLQLYTAATKRLFMWYYLQKKYNLVLVTEFPKCGGTWFCNMLSDALEVPFPRNVSPKLQQNIMHGHHLFHPRMNRAICVMRDGRDVMVSAYFHFLFDGPDKSSAEATRNKLNFSNYNNVIENMPAFIEYMFTDYAKKNFIHFSWSEMVQNTMKYSDSVCIIKYEDLLTDAAGQLEKAITFYNFPDLDIKKLGEIVEKYSFKNVTRRKQGEENRNSFVRKGISGDWKNYFNEEACAVFKKYAGKELIEMGYELNMNWKSELKNKPEQ